MAEYDNNMTGIIAKNDRKEKDSHPDVKGHAEIEGVQYWVSGWRKERNDGSGAFYSLRYTRKDEQRAAPAKKQAQVSMADDDGDIPF
jgi:hypothetical protein